MAILDRLQALQAPDPASPARFFVYVPEANGLYTVVAEKVSATFPKVAAKSRFSGGKNYYYPDNYEIDGLNITFYETSDFKVTSWLSKWRSQVVDSRGNYGLPSVYKKTITVVYFDLATESVLMQSNYTRCWPTDHNPWDLNYEDSDGRLVVDAQFSVENVE